MTTFVGYEYLMGNAFIYLTEERFITLKDLNSYLTKVQKYWNSNGIDAIITSEIDQATCLCQDYFEFQKEAGLIILKPGITKGMLEQRFVGYLPINILLSFKEAATQTS